MEDKALYEQILRLAGGKANISRETRRADALYLMLKDSGVVDLHALQTLDGMAAADLERGRLHLCLRDTTQEETKMPDNKQIARDVLEAVGGKENVASATHCMTRLRLVLKGEARPDDEVVKKIPGVLGVVRSGGQYQVIIGQNVPKVYEEVCNLTGLAAKAEVPADTPKKKLTLKSVGNSIMDYLSGSMSQLIPVMIAAAMFKTVLVVIGPDMLKLITADSDAYIVLDFLYDSFYYFLPIYLGKACAKRLGCNEMLGIMMGAILLVPNFTELIGTKDTLAIYGLFPAPVADYSQSILPVILAVWLMSYVERFFKKYMPVTLSTIFTPFLTMAIMVPVMFCICAPLGGYLGTVLGNILIAFQQSGGFLATAVVGALYAFIVMTGMHGVLLMAAMTTFFTLGYEDFVIVAGCCANCAAWGMALGAFFRLKQKETKFLAFGYFVSGILGGITEPSLYGVGIKYKKPLLSLLVGGFAGGLYVGIMHVKCYMLGATNFLSFLGFVAGGTANTVNYILGCVISIVLAAVTAYFVGGYGED